MDYQEALLKWGSEKLGPGSTATSVVISSEIEYGGYCETCSYEESYAGVRITGQDAKGKYSTEFLRDISLADILSEVLATSE